jgi:hypothetical protein
MKTKKSKKTATFIKPKPTKMWAIMGDWDVERMCQERRPGDQSLGSDLASSRASRPINTMSKPLMLGIAIAIPPAIAGVVFLLCTHLMLFVVATGLGMWLMISTAIYMEIKDRHIPSGRNL